MIFVVLAIGSAVFSSLPYKTRLEAVSIRQAPEAYSFRAGLAGSAASMCPGGREVRGAVWGCGSGRFAIWHQHRNRSARNVKNMYKRVVFMINTLRSGVIKIVWEFF